MTPLPLSPEDRAWPDARALMQAVHATRGARVCLASARSPQGRPPGCGAWGTGKPPGPAPGA